MSDPAQNVTQLTKPEKPSAALPVSVDVNNPTSLYLDTAVFNQINRVAVMMSRSNLAPAHLRSDEKVDRTADCILVVAQALRWRSDPFAVAQHTFVHKGKLGYEGKLIAAMINASGRLEEDLDYTYSGERGTRSRTVVVSATLKGSKRPREIEGSVADWATDNAQWKTPSGMDQMLAYRGAREWARRHMPQVLLGVNSEEEVAPRTMVDVTPSTSTAAQLNQVLTAASEGAVQDLRTVDGDVVDVTTGEIIEEGDKVEAEVKARDDASNAELDATAYLTGIIEDADLCDTIAALDAIDADVKKNLKPKSKQMTAWNAHKAQREVEILNRGRK